MVKQLLLMLLLIGAAMGQSAVFYTDRALGVNPFTPGTNGTPSPVFLSYAQVRVCSLPTSGSPCNTPATITDVFGNPLTVVGGNFGQLTTDVVGRFSFGCTPGLYQVQVAATGSNTPQLNYPITCPSGTSAILSTNNTWTGTNVFTQTGVFTNTQMNEYVQSLLNGCSPLTEFGATQAGNFGTDALTGCVAIPVGSTVHQGNAVVGYANTSANSSGRTVNNAVGGYFTCRDLANNAACWGLNPLVQDVVGLTGHSMQGIEVDVNLKGNPAFLRGVVVTGAPTTSTIPASAFAFSVESPSGLLWPTAFNSSDGSATQGMNLGAQTATANSDGQIINLIARDNTNTVRSVTIEAAHTTAGANLNLGTVTGSVAILNGISNDAAGFKHKRGVAGCVTGASVGAACTTVVTWTTAFPDANYTPQCMGAGITSGVPVNGGITAQVAASVTFQTVATTAATAQFTNIDCMAVHD